MRAGMSSDRKCEVFHDVRRRRAEGKRAFLWISVFTVIFVPVACLVEWAAHPWRYLISDAAKMTPLHWAAWDGRTDDVVRLLDEGANMHARCANGHTPLHYACLFGRVGAAAALIDHGADINAVGLKGSTPLHEAVTNGNAEVVRLLLTRGADTTLRNDHGRTPIQTAQYILSTRVPFIVRGSQHHLQNRVRPCEQLLLEHERARYKEIPREESNNE